MAGIIRLDKVQAVYNGNIVSVKNATEVMENGMIVKVGALEKDEREIHKAEKPQKADQVAILAAPEIVYDETRRTNQALENFVIEAGVAAPAYVLASGDIVSVSKDMVEALAGKVVVGNKVVADNSNKMKEIAEALAEHAFVGEILGTETVGGTMVVTSAGVLKRSTEYVVIKVIKNA